MDALSEPPNPLSKTLDSPQLVPSVPNPNVSFSGDTLTYNQPPPPVAAATPAAGDDIYSGLLDKEEPLEDPDPSSSFRIFDSDLSSPLTAAQPPASSSSLKDSGSWLFSGDAGGEEEPSRDEASGSAVVPSRVVRALSLLLLLLVLLGSVFVSVFLISCVLNRELGFGILVTRAFSMRSCSALRTRCP